MMGRTVYYDYNGNEIEPPKADPVSMTNADRIRSMTDEELAEFMRPWNSGCPRWKENPLPCSDWDNCGECWLKWLKEEVSE